MLQSFERLTFYAIDMIIRMRQSIEEHVHIFIISTQRASYLIYKIIYKLHLDFASFV